MEYEEMKEDEGLFDAEEDDEGSSCEESWGVG